MPRFPAAIVIAIALMAALAPVASAHQGDPNYRSVLTGVAPAQPGLKIQVLNYDDSFQLFNRTGRTVTIKGYSGEPYARVLGNGTVQVNRRSPAYYLNDDRLGQVQVPPTATPSATPQWQTVDETGRFIWHDHRMHWMSTVRPKQVTDTHRRTKIDDYAIPLTVGSKPARITGTLFWVGPAGGGLPVGAIVAFLVLAVVGGATVVLVRRRRRAGDDPPAAAAKGDVREAW